MAHVRFRKHTSLVLCFKVIGKHWGLYLYVTIRFEGSEDDLTQVSLAAGSLLHSPPIADRGSIA
jgi:hypothetical protein